MDEKMTKRLFKVYEYLIEKGEKKMAGEIKEIIVEVIASGPIKEYIPIYPSPPICPTPYPTPWEKYPWYDGIWCNVVENKGEFNNQSFIDTNTVDHTTMTLGNLEELTDGTRQRDE